MHLAKEKVTNTYLHCYMFSCKPVIWKKLILSQNVKLIINIMKTSLIIFLTILASYGAFSQTATNFICNDCDGVSHNLFEELDEGKVVILCWVMPCASCIGPTKTTYNVAQSFTLTHPGRVKMYVCDDFANTNCSSLNSWCNQNGLANTTRFSNSAIKMSDYGSNGMPKVVVIGNYTHQVYYNANNTVNITLLTNAIATALEDFSVSISDPALVDDIKIYPNPADNQVSLNFTSQKSGSCELTFFNTLAIQVSPSNYFDLKQGENTISVSTKELKNGIYFAHLKTDSGVKKAKFVVSH
jgi:hypothetical protein